MASERSSLTLNAQWGRLVVHPAAGHGPDRRLFDHGQPHARLADGRTVLWDSSGIAELPPDPIQFALDAESLGSPIPGHTRTLLGGDSEEEFLGRWTRLEVVAKLTGGPMILLLRQGVPHLKGLALTTVVWRDLVVSLGMVERMRRDDGARPELGARLADPLPSLRWY